jgi:formyl-CoA transferase
VSGYGQSGPKAGAAGFGSIGEAMGGLRFVTGSPDRPPSRAGVSLGDALAALFSVIGALSAFAEAQASGRGQEVDVAIYEAVAALMESSLADYEVMGVLRERTGSILPGVAPSNIYSTKDGSEILIAANAQSVFARLCQAMSRPELIDDPRFSSHTDRGLNMDELDKIISEWTSLHTCEELLITFDSYQVPSGNIYTAADMLADPQFLAREMIVRALTNQGLDIPMSGIVPKFSRTPGNVRLSGPKLGAHTKEVLKAFTEMSSTDLLKLESDGVTFSAADQDR